MTCYTGQPHILHLLPFMVHQKWYPGSGIEPAPRRYLGYLLFRMVPISGRNKGTQARTTSPGPGGTRRQTITRTFGDRRLMLEEGEDESSEPFSKHRMSAVESGGSSRMKILEMSNVYKRETLQRFAIWWSAATGLGGPAPR
jgi:hypothetical protein